VQQLARAPDQSGDQSGDQPGGQSGHGSGLVVERTGGALLD
jgi:hypothetical protein